MLVIVLSFSGYSLAQPVAGQQAPEIALPNLKGNTVRLSDHTGKVVLVDFWASWCGPCRKANPALLSLYNKYRRKGFEIFGVSIDDNKAALKKRLSLIKCHGYRCTKAADGTGRWHHNGRWKRSLLLICLTNRVK